jgi:hypothetical protein
MNARDRLAGRGNQQSRASTGPDDETAQMGVYA